MFPSITLKTCSIFWSHRVLVFYLGVCFISNLLTVQIILRLLFKTSFLLRFIQQLVEDIPGHAKKILQTKLKTVLKQVMLRFKIKGMSYFLQIQNKIKNRNMACFLTLSIPQRTALFFLEFLFALLKACCIFYWACLLLSIQRFVFVQVTVGCFRL